jgi:nitrite reductase/ring-hydroxylating ferredoxin subunit
MRALMAREGSDTVSRPTPVAALPEQDSETFVQPQSQQPRAATDRTQLDGWWAVASAAEIDDRPVPVQLAGTEIALYRDGGGVVRAVDDLCPHRRLPLSLGRVTPDGHIQCGYHGWIFDGESGRCTAIPNLSAKERPSGRIRVPVFRTATWHDLVTVWLGAGDPSPLPTATLPAASPRFRSAVEVRAPVDLVLDALAVNPGAVLGVGALLGGGEEGAAAAVRLDGDTLHVTRVRQTLGLRRVGTFDPVVDHITTSTTVLHLGTGLVEVEARDGVAGLTTQVTVGVAPLSGHRTSVRWAVAIDGRAAAMVGRMLAASAALRQRTGRAAAAFARLTDEVELQRDAATDVLRELRSVDMDSAAATRIHREEMP